MYRDSHLLPELRDCHLLDTLAITRWLHHIPSSLVSLLTNPLKLASTKKIINILFMSTLKKKKNLSICF